MVTKNTKALIEICSQLVFEANSKSKIIIYNKLSYILLLKK